MSSFSPTKIIPIYSLLLLPLLVIIVATSLCLLSLVVNCQIAVPKLNQDSDWFVIESEQTTSVLHESHFSTSTWRVSDYFSFKARIAFSVHRNSATGDTYELITLGHNHYYIAAIDNSNPFGEQHDVCHLDHRHDHSTLFPWRYSSPSSSGAFNLTLKGGGGAKTGTSAGGSAIPFHLIGVGALWMNLAQDKLAECLPIDYDGVARSRLQCKSSKRLKSTKYELEFEWPREVPLRAEVTRFLSVAHDQWTILEEIQQVIDIKNFRVYEGELAEPLMSNRIDQARALCEKVHESSSDTLFPSLMRHLASSDQRNYHISYTLNLFDKPTTVNGGDGSGGRRAPRQVIEKQTIQEWFSFQYKTQTFVRNVRRISEDRGEKEMGTEKLMRLFNVIEGSSVNYKLDLGQGREEVVPCEFTSLDNDPTLAGGASRLMMRPIRLATHGANNKNSKPTTTSGNISQAQAQVHHHQGELIGLGALLMNLADIKHKRHIVGGPSLDGSEISVPSYTYSPYITWIVEDFKESNQRFYIYFKKGSTLIRNVASAKSQIGDLTRIELQRRYPIDQIRGGQTSASSGNGPSRQRPLGALDDDERLERDRWAYAIVMEIDIIDFATTLFQTEIEKAFRVPPYCPPPGRADQLDIGGLEEAASDELLPDQDDDEREEESMMAEQELAPEMRFTFPSANDDWHAGIEENYKITSTWSLVADDKPGNPANKSFKVKEYLMVDQIGQSNLSRLRARLELIYSDGVVINYYIDYTSNTIFKLDSAHDCTRVEQLDEWLQVLSSKMTLAGYHQSTDQSSQPLRHYGIGGLWWLASRSAHLDLIAIDPIDGRQHQDNNNNHNKADDDNRQQLEAGLRRVLWALRDDPELVGNARAYFMMLMRPDNDDTGSQQQRNKSGAPDRMEQQLDSITVDCDGFWKMLASGVTSVRMTDIQIEPGQASADDFIVPPSCEKLASGGGEARRREFPTITGQLMAVASSSEHGPLPPPGDKLSELDFELSYDLHWATELHEVSMQVIETNLPGKTRICSLDLVSDQQSQVHLGFWSPIGRSNSWAGAMLEFQPQDRQRLCERAPYLEELLELNGLLAILSNGSAGSGHSDSEPDTSSSLSSHGYEELAGLPLANLWQTFVANFERNSNRILVETTLGKFHNREEREHTIWSLDTQWGLLQFETRPGLDQAERLSSVFIKKYSANERGELVYMSFKLNKVSRVDHLERNLKIVMPSACNKNTDAEPGESSEAWDQFPRLSKLVNTGNRVYMRSQVMTFGRISADEHSGNTTTTTSILEPMEFYYLDEWLMYNGAYRSQYSAAGLRGGEERRRHQSDQLILMPTREYFDLSKRHQCPMEPEDLGAKKAVRIPSLTLGGFVSESLFHSSHKIAFYGPLSLWMLAQDMTLERLFNGAYPSPNTHGFDLEHKLHIFHLFDEWRLTSWLMSERWLASHETFGQFILVFERTFEQIGVHGIHLERAEILNAGNKKEDTGLIPVAPTGPRLRVEKMDCRFVFDASKFEAFDAVLRIPAGFGCSRNQLARQQTDSFTRDFLVFEKLNPFEFHYEASLMVATAAAHTLPAGQHLVAKQVINSGKFMHCPEHWEKMLVGKLQVNRQELHHLDGRVSACTRVTTRDTSSSARGIIRLIKELNGYCRIALDTRQSVSAADDERILVLTFDEEIIELTMSMMTSYMQTMSSTERIQEFTHALDAVDKTTTIVYEAKLDNLRLNDRLQGPGSIVKTFKRIATSTTQFREYYHHDAKIELIVYDKAHLTFHLNHLSYIECSDIILAAKAEECFEDSSSDTMITGAWMPSSPADVGAASITSSSVGGLGNQHVTTHIRNRRRSFEMNFEARSKWDDTDGRHKRGPSTKPLTLEEFQLNRRYFERDFQRSFFIPPHRIPWSQLGQYWIEYRPSDGTIVARFNLLEPIALIHEFEQLYDHKIDVNAAGKLRAHGIELETKPASSKFTCSNLCEAQSHSCLAFSHCQDRMCTFLQTSNWPKLSEEHQDNDVESFLDKHFKTDPKCVVYYWPTFHANERQYINEIVHNIESQLAGTEAAGNKFVFEAKVSVSKRTKRIQFVGVELRELFSSLAADGFGMDEASTDTGGYSRLSEDFVLLSNQSNLHLVELVARHPSELSNLKTKLVEAQNLADCLALCESLGCQISSFCSASRLCSLVANLTDWEQFRMIAQEGDSSSSSLVLSPSSNSTSAKDCAIYSRDFTRDYERFDGTQEPINNIWIEKGFSPLECAAKCELSSLGAGSSQRFSAQDCLSFDYCFGASPEQPASCYGQKSHVIFDNLDRQLLEATVIPSNQHRARPRQRPRILGQQQQQQMTAAATNSSSDYDRNEPASPPICAHYSKSILADFSVVKGKKFAEHRSIIFHNMALDRCAVVCRRDETCVSLEYCSKPVKSDNTCYIHRRPTREEEEGGDKVETGASREGEKRMPEEEEQLLAMPECSIYTLRSGASWQITWPEEQALDQPATIVHGTESEEQQQPQSSDNETTDNRKNWKTSSIVLLCVIALTLGWLAGLFYRRIADSQKDSSVPLLVIALTLGSLMGFVHRKLTEWKTNKPTVWLCLIGLTLGLLLGLVQWKLT